MSEDIEIHHVSGELVPAFRPRWAPEPDQLLGPPLARRPDSRADMLTTTKDDFPQFLGPSRSLAVDGVRLFEDWSVRSPRLVWRQPIGAGWSAFSAVNGFAVTMEQRGEDELVTCYEVKTGAVLWAHATRARHETKLGGAGPRSTPTIHQGKVYTLGATGTLLCLDGATGEEVWSDDVLRRYGVQVRDDEKGVGWGRAGSPLLIDQLVVVPAGGPAGGPYVSLAAFNKDTGQLVWEGGDRQVSFSSPVEATLAGLRQILIVNENTVSGHDPASGSVLWEYDWPGGSTSNASVSQAVALEGDRVLLSKGYGGGTLLMSVSRSNPTGPLIASPVWQNPAVLKTKFTNVAVHKGFVYGLCDGILECVELAGGQRQWKRGRYGHGQVLRVGELLLVQAESGEVALVEATPKRFRQLGIFPALEGKTWNNPCLYGRYLLVRNAEQAACYELPLAGEGQDEL